MGSQIIMPDLGATSDEAVLVQWLVAEGDKITVGQPLFEVETDKSSLTVEASENGRIEKLLAQSGETVAVGSPIALLEGAVSGATVPEASAEVVSQPSLVTSAPVPDRVTRGRAPKPDVSPRARSLATELGVELVGLAGSGPGGRIVEADVRLAAGRSQSPRSRNEQGSDPLAGLSGVRAVIARRMAESAHTTAAVTLTAEVEADALLAVRQRVRDRLPELSDVLGIDFLLAVLAGRALGDHPGLNSSLEPGGIVHHSSANVGIAVHGSSGLVVPVLADVAGRSLADLGAAWRILRQRALEGRSTPEDLSGGTFTITNLGQAGIDAFTPIINPGECAVLGVGRIAERPVVHEGELRVGRTLVLSLTFDHRLVDGLPAARFLQRVRELIEEPDETIA